MAILAISLILLLSMLTSNIQQVKANPGCVAITVQYADGYPRSNAFVHWNNSTEWGAFGKTNGSGTKTRCEYLAPGPYQVSAWYPDLGTQFGKNRTLLVNSTGDGSKTITHENKSIEIHSPENKTYYTDSVPLNFAFHNSSAIFWTGYSLDGQANKTTDTPITGLSDGPHSIIVYGNDTNGYMGYSDLVYFTVQELPVGGIWFPVNKLQLLAPYIGLTTIIILATIATAIYVKWKKD